ncbi:hypothetical protein [Pseudonocardia sp.]|jgi:hypothetical protein|uniref:hypothetical protein n=1 Tax=Pseudonocardia sp. TaxID=60912 RepID=UPI003D0A5DAB
MTNQAPPSPARRSWLRRTALVALGVAVAGVLGATAAQASPSASETPSTIEVDTAWRKLAPLASEVIPAATCPADHPYLIKEKYAPDFVTLPAGVEAIIGGWFPGRLAPVGVSITGWNLVPNPTNPNNSLIIGTKDGPLDSSATNWTLGTGEYKLRLHCTNDIAQAATH